VNCAPGECIPSVPYTWGKGSGTPQSAFDAIAQLEPTHLIVNCGLWDCQGYHWLTDLPAFMAAAGNGTVFWKTTTLQPGQKWDPAVQHSIKSSFEQAGAKIWDAAAVMAPLSSNSSLYWFGSHTHCFVHNILNVDLVKAICPSPTEM
jgi:hypothetical protein